MKILLVDDSGTIRQVQKMILQGLGVTDFIEAADGFQAVRMAAELKPALILMDWNMPNMKGIEALKKLKASQLTAAIPVIMVTTEADKGHVLEAVRAGAANYVVKPFNAEIMKEKLSVYLNLYGIKAPSKAPPAPPKTEDKASDAGKPAEGENAAAADKPSDGDQSAGAESADIKTGEAGPATGASAAESKPAESKA